MSITAVAGTALSIGKALGPVFGSIFGNSRDEKRKARAEYQKALWNAGVDNHIYSQVHSDHWKQLQQIANFLEQQGQLGLMYINDVGTKSLGPRMPAPNPSASEVIAGYANWKRTSPIAQSFLSQGSDSDLSDTGRDGNVTAMSVGALPAWAGYAFAGIALAVAGFFILGK